MIEFISGTAHYKEVLSLENIRDFQNELRGWQGDFRVKVA